uniref:Uncharacterized protein n=1 Tax=Oryza meridionalis TaxID=40149 RepID=A0A0E0CPN2_9ORYZ
MFLTPEDAFELATKELQHTTVSRRDAPAMLVYGLLKS